MVICHKIWGVAESLCAALHGSLVVCTARGGSRIALSNVKYFYGVLILFFFAFFFMSDDLWPEKGWNVHIIQKTIKFCMYRNYTPSHHSCRNIFPVLFGTKMHCIFTFKLYTQCMRVEIYHMMLAALLHSRLIPACVVEFTSLKLQNHIVMAQKNQLTKTVWVCKWSTAYKELEYSKQEKRMCSLQFVFINCLSCCILLAIPFWPPCGSVSLKLPPVSSSSRLGFQLFSPYPFSAASASYPASIPLWNFG